ncbi:MAG: hypothetical protein ACI9U2_000203 [Bradymonadia bacterium]|jgi:hypothetical protein
MQRMDLEDALAELVHDLGKYLRLPLAWLPADASADDVRAAAEQALLATRRAGAETIAAASIWAAFTEEVGDSLTQYPGWTTLTQAVEGAFAWADRLDGPIDRAAVTADMSAVSPAIRSLLQAVSEGVSHG